MTKATPRKRPDPKSPPAATVAPHHTIVSLEVSGGFLKGCMFDFADGLNCIIGGRGTGKTTVLEFIRHALVSDGKGSRGRLLQSNLGNGLVRLHVRTKHGISYVAERPWNDDAQVLDENGEPTRISLDRDMIFKADVYGQNEIEEIASNPSSQLVLIDKFIDEDVRRIDAEMRRLVRDLEQNATEILRLERETIDLADSASEVKVLEEKLKGLQATAGPDAAILNAAHAQKALREKERKTLLRVRSEVSGVKMAFDALVSTTNRKLTSLVDADVIEGANKDIFTELVGKVEQLTRTLESCATRIGSECDAADETLTGQEELLAQRHARQDGEYRALIAKSQEESGRAAERAKLDQRYLEVTAARKELDGHKNERRAREKERQDLSAKLSSLRDERFALRKSIADRLTGAIGPIVRVTILQAGNREGYKALLTEGLKGTGIKYTVLVDRIAASTSPEELAVLVQRGDAARLAERAGIDEDRAKKVIESLRNSEIVFRIETVELEDQPRIELLDGDYKDASDLSTGQRCTAILPILLLESERPLLIDQPEDNLDNKFIYETVVKSLKDAKGSRQLIFVTHNPNIPVLGDAERVFVLGSDGRRASVEHRGTVDELKEQIETLLEGGKDAFLLRKQRYGH